METNANKKKQVLIKIRDLKQYFPVKGGRNEFVRANDGVTLDIYAGETLGIVGESGCGKSTLGRVILQLYHQTDGETMYYGHDRDYLAPKYALKTYKNLEADSKKAKLLIEKSEELKKEYEQIQKSTDQNNKDAVEKLYRKKEEYEEANKNAHRAFLNIVELVGGFFCTYDYKKASDAFVAYHKEAEKLMLLNEELKQLILTKEDYEIKAEETKNSQYEAKINEYKDKVSAKEKEIALQKSNYDKSLENIDILRKAEANNPEFLKYEKYLDNGINLARLDYKEMRKIRNEIQLIFQDPYSSLNPRFTVGQIIGEGLITHNYFKRNSEAMQEHIMEVMSDCGLQSYMIHRYPHQFSGGQRQRIGIARALSVKPKFVVCDEAVSALDVSIQSQIINLLQELKEKDNLTYMFISHDLSVVKYISDRIAVMYLGNVVELANTESIFKKPLHPYTEALIAAIPTVDKDVLDAPLLEGDIPSPINPPKGCKFHTRCRYAMDICKIVTPEFVELEKDHFVACHYRTGEGQTVSS